ncbi:hypothetical protein GLOTRDRAFT_34638 [Gloeophyllum trabeum ATCC 11539]|uniref:REM-1 domain-containing protein n=1 Tax=Gloeophyllum trabeum (strain ATCC 11539 / FP-39264 / Madison 617) TaxID=670483 RepID=S7S163_GLOTA|nr:uncharacterized protein GLOTRDRAFT_34638 [Gloeophyllum trabeum ATCC 11539]EPQ59464.1 hypothetical protein GLOTRDRAFT_34638 [Gloeophyllum trabeum ATCC 11539]
MDYRPRHPQPFTLTEATQLEVPIITEEIARLQNSLSHLQRTQDELKEHITATEAGDTVLEEAYTDNSRVIASQQERIAILKMALSNKGIPYSSHYDIGSQSQGTGRSSPGAPTTHAMTERSADDRGIDL